MQFAVFKINLKIETKENSLSKLNVTFSFSNSFSFDFELCNIFNQSIFDNLHIRITYTCLDIYDSVEI